MNLHGIVQGGVAAINPQTLAIIQTNTGYTSGAGGVRTPMFVTTTGYMDVLISPQRIFNISRV